MKPKHKLIVPFLLFGLAVGAFNPLQIWGADVGAGNAWQQYVDPPPYKGISLTGKVHIVYSSFILDNDPADNCFGFYNTLMSPTITLHYKNKSYTSCGTYPSVCKADLDTQNQILRSMLGSAVLSLPGFNKVKSLQVSSIDNGVYNLSPDGSYATFDADIQIYVKK